MPFSYFHSIGGSSGIGLSLALMLRKLGCSVTIIARDKTKLANAKTLIDEKTQGIDGELNIASADVSNFTDIQSAIIQCSNKYGGRVDVMVASAGVSRPGRLLEIPLQMYENMVKINYLGSLYATLVVAPIMKAQGSGRIIYVSSLAGLTGMIGFAGYSPTKFAVRGLAESVHMELRPYNIFTTLVNPPDVDTPMLQEEMQYKPEECKIISSDGGLFQPEDIAKDILDSIKSWRFMVNTGMDGWLLGIASAGLTTPVSSAGRALVEILLAGILRLVGIFYLYSWNGVCTNCHKQKSDQRRYLYYKCCVLI